MFKKILDKYNGIKLNYRIAIAIVIGTLLGIFLPGQKWIGELGVLFVGAMKGIAPILVFVLIVNSLSTGKTSLDKRFGKAFGYYMVSTVLAALVAVTASFLFPQNLQLAQEATTSATLPKGIGEILNNLLVRAVSNPFEAITEANYIGILVWAIIFGFAIKIHASDSTKRLLQDVTTSVTAIVHWFINLAPFGILGLLHSAIATNGIGIFKTYGMLVAVLAGAMFFMTFVVAPMIVSFAIKRDPYPLVIFCLKQSAITALFTRSSAANIPVNMDTCEKLKLDREFYSVSIPLGATINMDGAAAVITTFAMTAAFSVGMHPSLPMAILLSIVATFSACGASGVAGGSLLLVPLACSLFGIGADVAMQMVGVGFVVSVIQDSMETVLNSSGDVIFTATAEFREWKKQGKKLPL